MAVMNGNGNDDWGLRALRALVGSLLAYVVAAAVLLLLAALCGCSGPRAAVGSSSRAADTVYRLSVRQDTVRTRDSVWVETYRRGDTVFRVKEVTRWRDRLSARTDTVYRAAVRQDTIRVPVAVERRATWWERTVERPLEETCTVVLLVVAGAAVARWLARRREWKKL